MKQKQTKETKTGFVVIPCFFVSLVSFCSSFVREAGQHVHRCEARTTSKGTVDLCRTLSMVLP